MTLEEALEHRDRLRNEGRDLVFTNGCFDLIHAGHVHLLEQARDQGGFLVVGLNTDASVRRIKSDERPIMNETERKTVLEAFEMVDGVVFFDEDTPLRLIKELEPDVLVKGADYGEDDIVGAEWVRNQGGRVHRVPLVEGRGTSEIIRTIREGST